MGKAHTSYSHNPMAPTVVQASRARSHASFLPAFPCWQLPVHTMEGYDTVLCLLNLRVFSALNPGLVSTCWECWNPGTCRGATGSPSLGPLLAAPPAGWLLLEPSRLCCCLRAGLHWGCGWALW